MKRKRSSAPEGSDWSDPSLSPTEKPIKGEKRRKHGREPGLRVTIPGMVVLNSKPGGGKSHLTRYLMSEYRDQFAHGIAFSRSAFRPGNLDYMPNFEGTPKEQQRYLNFKHLYYEEEVLRNFLDLQAGYPEEERPLGFVIFDDDTSDPGMWKTSAMQDAATMYRQFNILLIINTQYVNLIPPVIRECAMQVAIFKTDTDRAIQACYDSYGQDFNRREEFQHFLFTATKDAVLGQKEHKFIWKDKEMDGPWRVLKAPTTIPKFRIEYGEKSSAKGRGKGKSKSAHASKRSTRGIGQNILNHVQDVKRETRGDPYEDGIQLPYREDLYREMFPDDHK
jgi:hypothetical protein